jgi:hypothetical protein
MKRALMLLTACSSVHAHRLLPRRRQHDARIPPGLVGAVARVLCIVTLIWGLFNHSVKIYEVHNSGWWYDLGFLLPCWAVRIGVHKRKSKREKE